MFYADTVGLKTVLAKLKEFQAQVRRRLQAGGAAGEAGGGGRDVCEVTRATLIRRFAPPSPEAGEGSDQSMNSEETHHA